VIFYSVPDGRHDSETVVAPDATEAAVQVRSKLLLAPEHFEVVGVIRDEPEFEQIDHRRVRLAP
jgi:hypothetical protein